MGYKLVPLRVDAIPLPDDVRKVHILKVYGEYVEKSKDKSKGYTLNQMYKDWAVGYAQALAVMGYDIIEEN